MKLYPLLSKFGLAACVCMLLLASCDYSPNDFPDKIEGKQYDLAVPVFHDTFSMHDLLVTYNGLKMPIGDLPDYVIELTPTNGLEYSLEIPDFSFITSDFDTDANMVVESFETRLNWYDNLPKGITIELLAFGKVGDNTIYLLNKDKGSIHSGSDTPVTNSLALSHTDLQLLPKMKDIKISFGLLIEQGTKVSVAELKKAWADINLGMRIKFNLDKLDQ